MSLQSVCEKAPERSSELPGQPLPVSAPARRPCRAPSISPEEIPMILYVRLDFDTGCTGRTEANATLYRREVP